MSPSRPPPARRLVPTLVIALAVALAATWLAAVAFLAIEAGRSRGASAVVAWILTVGVVATGLALAGSVVALRHVARDIVLLPRDVRSNDRGVRRRLARLPDRQQLRDELNAAIDVAEDSVRRAATDGRDDVQAISVVHAIIGDGSWKVPLGDEVSPGAAATLLRHMMTERPARIVHVGGGDMSLLLALAATRCGAERLVVLAPSDTTRRHTDDLLAGNDLRHAAVVGHPGIVSQTVLGATVPWLDVDGLELDGPIDLLVVDPPGGSIDPIQREPAIHLLADRLAERSVVVVDGADRPEGRHLIHRWCRHGGLRLVAEHRHPGGTTAELVPVARGGGASSSVAPSDRYVVVKGRFGLGDRIGAVLSGWQYAQRTGRRLVVDWNDPTYHSPQVTDVYRSLIGSPAVDDVDLGALLGHTAHPPEWTGLLTAFRADTDHAEMPYHLSHARPPDHDVDDEVVVVTRRYRDNAWTAAIGAVLAPSAPLAAAVESFAEQHLHGPVVGVHVRHGNGEFLVTPPRTEWFHQRVEQLAGDGATVFLATDSAEVEAEFRDRHRDRRVVTTPKWLPPPGSGALHQHRDCPDRFQGAVEALIDMWLLARCDRLLLSPGVFATVARGLSAIPDDAVDTYDGQVHPRLRDKRGWRGR